jgi:hypothetical protein
MSRTRNDAGAVLREAGGADKREDDMTSRKPRRLGLAIALNVIAFAPPLLVIASSGPIKAAFGSGVVFALVAGATAWTALCGLGLSILQYNGLDEVQRAHQQSALHWGMLIGVCGAGILLFVPGFLSLVTNLPTTIAGGPADASSRKALIVAFMMGFMTLLLLQAVGTAAVSIGWRIAKR